MQARKSTRKKSRKRAPWELTEKDIYRHQDWVLNPVLLEWALMRPLDEKLEWGPDPLYAYRGVGESEVDNVLRHRKSGTFWYNYPNAAFAKAGFFIMKRPVRGPKIPMEIPEAISGTWKDMKAIYIRPSAYGSRFGPMLRIKPVMTLDEWLKYYPGKKRMYYALYGKPDVIRLLEYSSIPEYWEWAGELRRARKEGL